MILEARQVIIASFAAGVSAVTAIHGCAGSQAQTDGEHGFEHTLALSRCEQAARLAATKAGGGSLTAGGSDAGDVAAIEAYKSCVLGMKEGGV